MAKITAAALRADIAEAYANYMTQLRQAGPTWENLPARGDGEEAWSARQVAEHVAGACGFFGAVLAKAIGVPGPGRTYSELPTAQAAVDTMPLALDAVMAICSRITDDHLDTEVEFGPMGRTTLDKAIGVVAYHLNDHAQQIQSLNALPQPSRDR